MYSFFVLGLIPGTGVQISFAMWVETMLVIGLSIYLYFSLRREITLIPLVAVTGTFKTQRLVQVIRHIISALPIRKAFHRWHWRLRVPVNLQDI